MVGREGRHARRLGTVAAGIAFALIGTVAVPGAAAPLDWGTMTPAQRAAVWPRIAPERRQFLWSVMDRMERQALAAELDLASAGHTPSGRPMLPWNDMSRKERLDAWMEMPAVDRQFYWRRMVPSERKAMRKELARLNCEDTCDPLRRHQKGDAARWRSQSSADRERFRIDIFVHRRGPDSECRTPERCGPGGGRHRRAGE